MLREYLLRQKNTSFSLPLQPLKVSSPLLCTGNVGTRGRVPRAKLDAMGRFCSRVRFATVFIAQEAGWKGSWGGVHGLRGPPAVCHRVMSMVLWERRSQMSLRAFSCSRTLESRTLRGAQRDGWDRATGRDAWGCEDGARLTNCGSSGRMTHLSGVLDQVARRHGRSVFSLSVSNS